MYNPEKQARAAGGRFGGKVKEIVAAGEAEAKVIATNVETATEQAAAYLGEHVPLVARAERYAEEHLAPGAFMLIPNPESTSITTRQVVLLAIAVVAILAVLTRCV